MGCRVPSLCVCLLLLGCNEYGLNGPSQVQGRVGPDLLVTPERVDQVFCGFGGSTTVELRNGGSASVEISDLSLEGTGWSMDPPELPVRLATDESLSLTLEVGQGGGEAELIVWSSDPDHEEVHVPLSAVADGPPLVAITAPRAVQALAPDGPVALEGTVDDDLDTELTVRWSSVVDGSLVPEQVLPVGVVETLWAAADRTSGPQIVTLEAEDSCGNVGRAEVELCQQDGRLIDDLALNTWHYEGSASWDSVNDWLQLTSDGPGQVGSAFQTQQVVPADSVEISFRFFAGDHDGADGLSLTALDVSRMTGFLGGDGCGLGYGGDAADGCTTGPALPGWSLEVDTYANGNDPTSADHLMFTFDGDVDDPAAWVALPEMEGGWHEMAVRVAAPRLEVRVDGTLYLDEVLPDGHFDFDAYVGFTAGTGALTNRHLIDGLEVYEWVCPE